VSQAPQNPDRPASPGGRRKRVPPAGRGPPRAADSGTSVSRRDAGPVRVVVHKTSSQPPGGSIRDAGGRVVVGSGYQRITGMRPGDREAQSIQTEGPLKREGYSAGGAERAGRGLMWTKLGSLITTALRGGDRRSDGR
jgi:hypothetical protein